MVTRIAGSRRGDALSPVAAVPRGHYADSHSPYSASSNDNGTADGLWSPARCHEVTPATYGVEGEYGTLRSVLMASPEHLDLVPSNSVSQESMRNGLSCSALEAFEQHTALVTALANEGVDVHVGPPASGMPDLCVARDAATMTPWGMICLAPGAAHRRAEVGMLLTSLEAIRVPVIGRIESGRIEGGDVCIVRPGLVVIGVSGVRTDESGADALASVFHSAGWDVRRQSFDPHFLHLDTQFCMVDRNLALACTDVLDDSFLDWVRAQGIDMLPVSYKEARRLGCNVLSLGDRRVISAGSTPRVDAALEQRGYRVIQVPLSQFTRCGGGAHCLTLPLARSEVPSI